MGVGGCGVTSGFEYGRARIQRCEDDGFGMVLRPDAHVREDRIQGRLELLVFELVAVEWVGPNLGAHLGVIGFVGRGNQESAAGFQNTVGFGKQVGPAFQMFDDFEGGDEIKGPVGEREGFAGRVYKTNSGAAEVFTGVGESFGGDVGRSDGGCAVQLRSPVT